MRPIKNPQIGKFLRKARQDKDLSLRALAEASGVDYTTIAKMERGQYSKPDPKKLQKLARALDVEVEDFYALAGYMAPEGLPELAPYLRAKYDLPDTAVADLDAYFQKLRETYGESKKPTARKRGSSGKPRR